MLAVFLPIFLGFGLLGFVAEGLMWKFKQTMPRPFRYDYQLTPLLNTPSAGAAFGLFVVMLVGWDYSQMVASHPTHYTSVVIGWMIGRSAFVRIQNKSFFGPQYFYVLRE